MKKILFSTIAILALAVMGCNKSELVPEQENAFTIKASIENFGTKTTMDGNTVIWEEGDQIAVLVENQPPVLYTLQSGAGTPNGTFQITGNSVFSPAPEQENNIAVLYPYNADARYINGTITTSLASSYEWKEGANGKAPMAAITSFNQLSNEITFQNAGALIALTVNNIPAGYKSISMTSSGIKINGATEISFTDGVPSSEVTATDDANKTITINFAAAATTTDKVFYFPLGTTETATDITIAMSDGSNTQTLYNDKAMARAVRNKRYYTSISFDGMGNLPTPLAASEDINTKIGEGTTNFILDENANDVNITEETTKELQIAVTSGNATFELSGEGPKGNIDLYTPANTQNLNLNVPNATVELKPDEGFATFETITATTAENTLIIPAGVTVNNLTIKGGNVRVFGKVVNISNEKSTGKVKIYKGEGAEIPEELDTDKFEIVTLKTITTVEALKESIEGAKDNEIITFGVDLEISEIITINKNITLDLNGKTVTANCKKAFEVYADATIKNGTINSLSRCVDTRTNVNLNLENVTLIADKYHSTYGNPQPLTIGGSTHGTIVTLTDVNINAGKSGYCIISFVETDLDATNCTLTGYSAYYAKGGSEGSTFDFNNCSLTGDCTNNDVEGNSFSVIAIQSSSVTVNVNGGSVIAKGNNMYAIGIGCTTLTGLTNNAITVKEATIEGRILDLAEDDLDNNIVKIPNDGTYKTWLNNAGLGYTQNDDGTITIKKN